MLDHVTANVGDFDAAKRFYAQALGPLGYSLQMEFEGGAGFGSGEGIPDFWIGSSDERGATHVAFNAGDRSAVDAFYEAAMAGGGKGQRRSRTASALPRELLRGLRPRSGQQQHRGGVPQAGMRRGKRF